MNYYIQIKLFETDQVYRTAHGKYVKVLEVDRKVEPVCVKVQFINTFMNPISNPCEMFATRITTNYTNIQYESILLPVDDNVSSLDKVGLDVSEQPDSGIRLLKPCEDYGYENEMYDDSEYGGLADQLIRDYHRYKIRIDYIKHIAKKFNIDLED